MSKYIRLSLPRQQEASGNTFVVNATNSVIAAANSNSCYITPIQEKAGFFQSLVYNSDTGEVGYAYGGAGGGGGWWKNDAYGFYGPSGQSYALSGGASQNLIAGRDAGINLTNGTSNVILGHGCGEIFTTGNNRTLVGVAAGLNVGQCSTGVGYQALSATTGSYNTALGYLANADTIHDHTITLNAQSIALNPNKPNAFFVKPIASGSTNNALYYDLGSGEVTYAPPTGGGGGGGTGGGALAYNPSLSNVYGPSSASLNTYATGGGNVALGVNALSALGAGTNNLALGSAALAAATGTSGVVCLNATGAVFPATDTATNNSFYVKPVRAVPAHGGLTTDKCLWYDESTGEVVSADASSTSFVSLSGGYWDLKTYGIRYPVEDALPLGVGLRMDPDAAYTLSVSGDMQFNPSGHMYIVGSQAVPYGGAAAGTPGSVNVGHNIAKEVLFMDVRENTALGGGALHLQSELYAGQIDASAARYNVAIGAHAMMQAGNANYNVAIGNWAMVGEFDTNGILPAVQYSAAGNTAIGVFCMQVPAVPVMEDANATSMANTAVGYSAARVLQRGANNVAMGYEAMGGGFDAVEDVSGEFGPTNALAWSSTAWTQFNTTIGQRAGYGLHSGSNNTLVGAGALSLPGLGGGVCRTEDGEFDPSGQQVLGNTMVGVNAGASVWRGKYNTCLGMEAMGGRMAAPHSDATTGDNNVAIGYQAMFHGDVSNCICINAAGADGSGAYDMTGNPAGFYVAPINTGLQSHVLYYDPETCEITHDSAGGGGGGGGQLAYDTTLYNVYGPSSNSLPITATGTLNTALGRDTLSSLTDGTGNVAIGEKALMSSTQGSYNLALGYEACRDQQPGHSNVICLNATGSAFPSATANHTAFYVKPIRTGTAADVLYYDHATGEITYDASSGGSGGGGDGVGELAYNSTKANVYGPSAASLNTATLGHKNVALGVDALSSLTDGSRNVAIGTDALKLNTNMGDMTAVGNGALSKILTGQSSTAVGSGALGENQSGSYNTALGVNAMGEGPDGSNNTAVGHAALKENRANDNTAVGYDCLASCTTGEQNVAVGANALNALVNGSNNLALGSAALGAATGSSGVVCLNATGSDFPSAPIQNDAFYVKPVRDTGVGTNRLLYYSLTTGEVTSASGQVFTAGTSWMYKNTSNFYGPSSNSIPPGATGQDNTAVGTESMTSLTSASQNTALGYEAMQKLTSGTNNVAVGSKAGKGHAAAGGEYTSCTAVGYEALHNNDNSWNTAVGCEALKSNRGGHQNVAVGGRALISQVDGSRNVAIGDASLFNASGGSYNVAVGYEAASQVTTGNNNLALGYRAMADAGATGTEPSGVICLNATGIDFIGSSVPHTDAFYVKPIRMQGQYHGLYYDENSGEITYDLSGGGSGGGGGSSGAGPRITQTIWNPSGEFDSSGTGAVNIFGHQPDTSGNLYPGVDITYQNTGTGVGVGDMSGQFVIGSEGTYFVGANVHLLAPYPIDASCNLSVYLNGQPHPGASWDVGIPALTAYDGGIEQSIGLIADLVDTDKITFMLENNSGTNIIPTMGTTANIFKLGGGSGGGSGDAVIVDGSGTLSSQRKDAGNDASGDYSVAMGRDCTALGIYSVAMGENCSTLGANAVSLGEFCHADNWAMAMGKKNRALGDYSVAMGYECSASGQFSFADGSGCAANTPGGVAMGWGCTASGSPDYWPHGGNVAMGRECVASGPQSVALGANSSSTHSQSFALGYQCNAYNNAAFAMGEWCGATGWGSLAQGTDCHADASNAVAMGRECTASGDYAVAMGLNCIAGGPNSFADGSGCEANGGFAVAMGLRCQANQYYSVAMGRDCSASGYAAVSMGEGNHARGNESVALGWYSTTGGAGAANADASGFCAFAMGASCEAIQDYSVAMGHDCSASGWGAVAMGERNHARGNESFAMGYHNTTGISGVPLGQDASGFGAIAMGVSCEAINNYTVAIGCGCRVTADYGVALGNAADASGTCGFMYRDGANNEFCFDSANGGSLMINNQVVAGGGGGGFAFLSYTTLADQQAAPAAIAALPGGTPVKITLVGGGASGGGGNLSPSLMGGGGGGGGGISYWTTAADASGTAATWYVVGQGGAGTQAGQGGNNGSPTYTNSGLLQGNGGLGGGFAGGGGAGGVGSTSAGGLLLRGGHGSTGNAHGAGLGGAGAGMIYGGVGGSAGAGSDGGAAPGASVDGEGGCVLFEWYSS